MAKLALVIAEENFQELCAIIPPSYDRSEIAILAGIDINTPPGVDDFFVPTEFKIRQKDGTFVSFLDNVISQVRVSVSVCVSLSLCLSVCFWFPLLHILPVSVSLLTPTPNFPLS